MENDCSISRSLLVETKIIYAFRPSLNMDLVCNNLVVEVVRVGEGNLD